MHRRVLHALIGLAGLAILAAAPLPQLDADTPLYTQIAANILTTRDWLTLRHPGWQVDKPPVQFWLMAASFKVFGISDITVRLWQLILALALIALTYLVARAAGCSLEEGLLAAVILATSIQFFYQAIVPQQDVPLALFLTLALYGLLRYLQDGSGRWITLCAVAVALAVLSKGVAGLGLFGLVLLVTLLVVRPGTPHPRSQLFAHVTLATAVFVALALPWFVIGALRQGEPFVRTFLTGGALGVGRFFHPAGSTSPYLPSIFAYVPLLFLGVLPWSPILTMSVVELPRVFRTGTMGLRMVAVWFLAIFVALSLSPGDKVFRYLLPCMPPVAVLSGRTMAALFGDRRRLRLAGWISVIPAVVFIGAGFWFLWSRFPPERALLIAVVLPFLIALVAGLVGFGLAALGGRGRLAVIVATVATVAGFALFEGGMFVHRAAINPWPAIAAAAAPLTSVSDRVILYGRAGEAYNFATFYLDEPVVSVASPSELALLWRRERLIVVIPTERFQDLAQALDPSPVVIHRSPASLVVVANWVTPSH
ncbi:MAG: ArnT family glycosyltransferase [Armatimonadota bacterium]